MKTIFQSHDMFNFPFVWTNYLITINIGCRSVKLTGPFVTMIYKMLLGDLLRFGVIYSIFLLSFTQGKFSAGIKVSMLVFVVEYRYIDTSMSMGVQHVTYSINLVCTVYAKTICELNHQIN